uniref:Uncharacterized protein n=1 Tax=Cacopsylla melanoneura TaxID=428564 RepID=A0A8D8WBX3_9HEMI
MCWELTFIVTFFYRYLIFLSHFLLSFFSFDLCSGGAWRICQSLFSCRYLLFSVFSLIYPGLVILQKKYSYFFVINFNFISFISLQISRNINPSPFFHHPSIRFIFYTTVKDLLTIN